MCYQEAPSYTITKLQVIQQTSPWIVTQVPAHCLSMCYQVAAHQTGNELRESTG